MDSPIENKLPSKSLTPLSECLGLSSPYYNLAALGKVIFTGLVRFTPAILFVLSLVPVAGTNWVPTDRDSTWGGGGADKGLAAVERANGLGSQVRKHLVKLTLFFHNIDVSIINDNSQLSFNYIWKQFCFSLVLGCFFFLWWE